MRRLVAVLLIATASLATPHPANAAGAGDCYLGGSGGFWGDQAGVIVNGACVPVSQAGSAVSAGAVIPTRTISCGRPADLGGTWNVGQCGAQVACYVDGELTDTLQIQQQINGVWVPVSTWCPGDPDPVLRSEALREAALRLIPEIKVGVTPGLNLVQTQTILWADTDADRGLGQVTVVGQNVHLRVHFDSATWDFGDGTSATTEHPGAAYPSEGECKQASCSQYFGHVYKTTGEMTVSLTVTWTADFSLNSTDWQPIVTDPLPGPASTRTIELKEARGVLVPNPGER